MHRYGEGWRHTRTREGGKTAEQMRGRGKDGFRRGAREEEGGRKSLKSTGDG